MRGARLATVVAMAALTALATCTVSASATGRPNPGRHPKASPSPSGGLPTPDFAVHISDHPDPVFVGHQVTYTVSVTYTDDSAGLPALVVDTLPANVTFVSATPDGTVIAQCVSAQQLLSGCPVTPDPNGDPGTLTIVVKPTAAGTLTDVASVVFVDSTPQDNLATETTTVEDAPTSSPPPTTHPPHTTNPPPTTVGPTGGTPSGGVQTGAGGTASSGFPVVPVSGGLGGLAVAVGAWVLRRRVRA